MLECDYIVKQIDGEYAHLQNLDGSFAESRPAGGRTQACGESTTAG